MWERHILFFWKKRNKTGERTLPWTEYISFCLCCLYTLAISFQVLQFSVKARIWVYIRSRQLSTSSPSRFRVTLAGYCLLYNIIWHFTRFILRGWRFVSLVLLALRKKRTGFDIFRASLLCNINRSYETIKHTFPL